MKLNRGSEIVSVVVEVEVEASGALRVRKEDVRYSDRKRVVRLERALSILRA